MSRKWLTMSVSSDDADTIAPSALEAESSSSLIETNLGASQASTGVLDPTSPSLALLETFSKLMCAFSFDEAKGLVEKQAAQKSNEALWGFLLQVAGNITIVEKQYLNLSFLAPKGFLRKESNLRSSWEHLRHELQKFTETDFENFASELLFLVAIRLDQMDFYEKLSLLGTAKNVEIEDLISDYELITEKYSNRRRAVLGIRLGFPQIFTSIGWEVEALIYLLKAHSAMQVWDFFSSVSYSQDAQKRLSEWAEFLQMLQNSKKSSFLNSGSANPSLYVWLVKLKSTLLSKFSLYFYEILAQYSNPAFDIKMASTKLHTDYFAKISSFVKKSDALCACLIFDARDTAFNPNGYTFPARLQEAPTGLSSFPAILAVPFKPVNHWPSVVMLLNNHFSELCADKLVGFFDTRAQTTYFLLKIDVRMYLVIIYELKKSEKDGQVVKFMSEMSVDLKCRKIFASLRTIAK